MAENRSPWLYQLKYNRTIQTLTKDESADIVVVGAGISGVSTAFFILEETNKNVILIEKDILAHGATGHNAGHVLTYLEKPFKDIINEYSEEMAVEAYFDLENTWKHLDRMYEKISSKTQFTKLIGYAGYSDQKRVFLELEILHIQKKHGLPVHTLMISDDLPWISEIPLEYKNEYILCKQQDILDLLETKDTQYISCLPYKVACVNSAKICEDTIEYMEKMHSRRFKFFEHTPVNKVIVNNGKVIVDTIKHTITAEKIVLCTNGFENFTIISDNSLEIDNKFHHEIYGVVGYMSAFTEKEKKDAFAGEYYSKEKVQDQVKGDIDPYFYVTRRLYDLGGPNKVNLVAVGGPEIYLEDKDTYSRTHEYPEDAKTRIDEFVKQTFSKEPVSKEEPFLWHGLMGYTKSLLRIVGEDKKNQNVLYNVGCNGVGILSSVFGAFKIAKIIKGDKFKPSIFDPK